MSALPWDRARRIEGSEVTGLSQSATGFRRPDGRLRRPSGLGPAAKELTLMEDSVPRCCTCGSSARYPLTIRSENHLGDPSEDPLCWSCLLQLVEQIRRAGNRMVVEEIESDVPLAPVITR